MAFWHSVMLERFPPTRLLLDRTMRHFYGCRAGGKIWQEYEEILWAFVLWRFPQGTQSNIPINIHSKLMTRGLYFCNDKKESEGNVKPILQSSIAKNGTIGLNSPTPKADIFIAFIELRHNIFDKNRHIAQ